MRSFAIRALRSRNLEFTSLAVQNIDEMTHPSLVDIQDSQNVAVQQSSFDNINVIVKGNTSIINLKNVADSRVTKCSVFNTRYGLFEEDQRKNNKQEVEPTQLALVNAENVASTKFSDLNMSGNTTETTGVTNAGFAALKVKNSKDVEFSHIQANDNLVNGDQDALFTRCSAIKVEKSSYVIVRYNQTNSTGIVGSGGMAIAIGIEVQRSTEVRVEYNASNDAYAFDTAGESECYGIECDEMEGDCQVSCCQVNNNGKGSTVGGGIVGKGESVDVSFDIFKNTANGTRGVLVSVGISSESDNTSLSDNTADNTETDEPEDFHTNLEVRKRMQSRLKPKLQKPGQKKKKFLKDNATLRQEARVRYNVNAVNPMAAGFLLTGTETREQNSCTVTRCKASNRPIPQAELHEAGFFQAENILANFDAHHLRNRQLAGRVTTGLRAGTVRFPNRLARASNGITALNNNFSNFTAGIAFTEVKSSQVTRNSVKKSDVGIDLDAGLNHNIDGNTSIGSVVGVLATTQNAIINGNKVQEAQVGVLDGSETANMITSTQTLNTIASIRSLVGRVPQVALDRLTANFIRVTGAPQQTNAQDNVDTPLQNAPQDKVDFSAEQYAARR